MDRAIITNKGQYTLFIYDGKTIRFKAPYSLEYYTDVKEWDNGYIVVMAKYYHNTKAEEEYIDLIPVLRNLYINPDEFLKPIKEVIVKNDLEMGTI